MRRGFTFVEALACILILSVSITAGLGMLLYAVRQAGRAQSKVTAMATAQTVAYDPAPSVFPGDTWPEIDNGGGTMEGWLNGYFIKRVQRAGTSLDAAGKLKVVVVHVEAYEGKSGALAASFSTRVVQGSTP